MFLIIGVDLHAFNGDNNVRATIEKALQDHQELPNESQVLLLERTLQKAQEFLTPTDSTTLKVYKLLSDWHFKNRHFETSQEYAFTNLSLLKEVGAPENQIAEAETRLAECYKFSYKLDLAEELYRSSLSRRPVKLDPENFTNHLGLAMISASQGNYDLMVQHAEKALSISLTLRQECEALWYKFQGFAKRRNIGKSEEVVNQLLSRAKATGSSYEKGRAYSQLAFLELIKKDYNKAIKYYDKAIALMNANNDPKKHRSISSAYTSLSGCYSRLKKRDLAIQYAKKAIEESQAFFKTEYHPDIGINYHNLAFRYTRVKDWESALRYEQNAIKCFLNDPEFNDNGKTISVNDLRKVSVKWQLLLSLKGKGFYYAYLYLDHKNKEDIENAIKHMTNAIELIDIMRSEMETDNTKIYWSKETRSIYNTVVEMCEWVQDLDCMQKTIEKSRALILLDELNHKEALSMMPQRLTKREKALRTTVVDSPNTDVDAIESYNRFLDSIKVAYPSYYKYKFQTASAPIEEIQSSLESDSTQIIQYFLTPDSLYTLAIDTKKADYYTQPAPKNLKRDIRRTLSLLDNKDSLDYELKFREFTATSSRLYDIFLEPIKDKKKKLVIIGDGIINYLPFDILISDASTIRYAIQDHAISYAPSLSVLMKIDKHRSFDELLMVNPLSYEKENLVSLDLSRDEADYLGRLSNLDLLEASHASLKNFTERSQEADVIHLSTHSGIDSLTKEPWIAFHDSLIGVNEIIKLNLNASLVALSSCSSLDGKNNNSEGVNSLARAFLFADVSSVVGSLWELNEDSGYHILMDFYSNLKEGENKSDALRSAKLKYIENNKYKSPYHWASLVIIGDPSSIFGEKSYGASKYLVAGISLLLLLLLLQKYRN